MKKTLIIVIVIAVLILGAFILLSRPQGNIQNAIDDAKLKATEASLRAFVASTMADMAQYYSNEKNTTPYSSNPATEQMLDAKFAEIKNKYQGDFKYKVLDEKENAAVKAAETSAGIYVCIDSLTAKTTTIAASEFDKNTDCSGQVLK